MSLLPTEETSIPEQSGSESGTTEILSAKSSSVKPSKSEISLFSSEIEAIFLATEHNPKSRAVST